MALECTIPMVVLEEDHTGVVSMAIACIGVHMVAAHMEVPGCMEVECITVDLVDRWVAMGWAWVVHMVIKIQTIHLVNLHHLQASGCHSLMW